MKRARSVVVGLACLGCAAHLAAQTAVSAHGIIESTSGGFKFPDGSVQTTAVGAFLAPVEKTGQSQCFDEEGDLRDCAGTGEDGEFRSGVAWPDPRFSDNGDGTITDNLTGLTWLMDANCPGRQKTWQEALDWVAQLNTTAVICAEYTALTHTDWRLPSVRELRSLIDYGRLDPALPAGHPFVGVRSYHYWSASSSLLRPAHAWEVLLFNGLVYDTRKQATFYLWPVRGMDRIDRQVAATTLSVDGVIESLWGGYVFPNGTCQSTAATAAPVEDSGQSQCFAEDGAPRSCAGTGQDGELQAGVAWPTPRFRDNGDGA